VDDRLGILGVWDGHEASVALVHRGELVFALSEERPARQKRCSGFPRRAMDACLAWAAEQGVDVGAVALAGRWGRAPLRLAEPLYASTSPLRDPLSPGSVAVRAWETHLSHRRSARRIEAAVGLLPIRRRLARRLGHRIPLYTVDHHRAHAFAAMLAADRDGALVLTWDAYGDGLAATCRRADAPDDVLATLPVDAGVARLWGAVTVALGYQEGDEGKVMGLAARGRPGPAGDRILGLFSVGEGAPRLRRPLDAAAVQHLVSGLDREEIAAGLQAATVELVTGWTGGLLERHPGVQRVLLAGGLFANVLLNDALVASRPLTPVDVFAAVGDGGLSAGAAHEVYRRLTGRFATPARHVFLGCGVDPAAAERSATAAGLRGSRVEAPAQRAGEHLAAGHVVCRFTGREEFGPRALGHRSILFRADAPALAERVGRALGRDRSMPFGPALRDEDLSLLAGQTAASSLRTMTRAVHATPALRRLAPIAVHVDGSTRPQAVSRSATPGLWTTLDVLKARGGPPAAINTSFNLHGEPIVHDAQDAVRSFLRSGLDVLYLGNLELIRTGGVCPRAG